jgi:hypothetical protein
MTNNQWLATVINRLLDMSDNERFEVIMEIANHFCLKCGKEHPSEIIRCQCWNDE